LQIEVNRGLYFDEERLEKKPGFDRLRADLTDFIDALIALVESDMLEVPLAAE
jgi:N-formylglutamate deformylase